MRDKIKKTFKKGEGLKVINKNVPESMSNLIELVKSQYGIQSEISKIFEKTFVNTYQTTLQIQEDGSTFVITGDIPAMWNRDSVAQIRPLLNLVSNDLQIKTLVRGVIEKHKDQIILDPYANAHNLSPTEGEHSGDDLTEMHPLVWERKYELDSLCYPIQLVYLYWKQTHDNTIFDKKFLKMAKLIVSTLSIEQTHENSKYSFRRIADWLLFNEPERIEFETLPCKGKGKPVSYTGMTWSGFRPSDDACMYGYLIPANMFAVVILRYLEEIIQSQYDDSMKFVNKIIDLREEIDKGIQKYGVIEHPQYGKIYAYEVDGLGNYNLMDDANVPSLLSAPYLGYCNIDDPIYKNTRNFILSKDNPYFFIGKYGKGIGSPHTPENYFWHISLAIEGLTTNDEVEKKRIMKQFISTSAMSLMHEGVNVDNPDEFTRSWFSWANSIFSEFVLKECGVYIDSKGHAMQQEGY